MQTMQLPLCYLLGFQEMPNMHRWIPKPFKEHLLNLPTNILPKLGNKTVPGLQHHPPELPHLLIALHLPILPPITLPVSVAPQLRMHRLDGVQTNTQTLCKHPADVLLAMHPTMRLVRNIK